MTSDTTHPRPNIIFVLLDEMRYPVHFPAGVHSADEFIARFMPHTYRLLWSTGVKLSNYYTPACDCTPARATIATGLYAQQTHCVATRANPMNPQGTGAPQPALEPAFPTYGKLLRQAGYDTPWIGKWHLSNFPASYESSAMPWYLRDYGFDGLTVPDPLGLAGQGVGAIPASAPPVGATPQVSDIQIATAAVTWLQARAAQTDTRPFCLTVSLVNPHDKQWFWGGIEASRYNQMYQEAGIPAPAPGTYDVVWQMDPRPVGYTLPDNWQARSRAGEPRLHAVFREMTDAMFGGIADDPTVESFTMGPNPIQLFQQNALAPHEYWTRALDMYTQAISDVDVQIAQVIQNIPPSLRDNTVVVLTSDHGEYSSSHGMQGKGMTVYQESMHVPFCFTDFTGRYATEPGTRTQPGSHVDLLPFFGRLAYGDDSWSRQPAYAGLYERRNDLLAVIRDPLAPVQRNYNLHSADEPIPAELNYLGAPEHVLAYVDAEHKLGVYSYWKHGTSAPLSRGQETEYYDYRQDPRQLELDSRPDSPEATALREALLTRYLPEEMQAPLPEAYQAAQQSALDAYWKYVEMATAGMAILSRAM